MLTMINNVHGQTIHPCGTDGAIDVAVKNKFETRKSSEIISQPSPNYPREALFKHANGIVSLKVTFLANGKIGKISVIKDLPEGLTNEAIKAARQIKFVPGRKNGKRVTVTKIVEYRFRGLSKCL